MLNAKELKRLADKRENGPATDEVKKLPKLKLSGSFYWLGLAIVTPLSVPLLVITKELIKPFRKQRY